MTPASSRRSATVQRRLRPLAWAGTALAAFGLMACSAEKPADPGEHVGSASQALWGDPGFESDTVGSAPAASWTVTPHVNNGVTVQSPQTYAGLSLANGGAAATVAVGTGSDPDAPSITFPKFGTRSAVVNFGYNSTTHAVTVQGDGRNANELVQTATMASGDVDAVDGLVHVRFVLAPVLEDPGHPQTDQPYFFVQLTNVTQGNKVIFESYNFSNQSGVTWGNAGTNSRGNTVLYTDWTLVDVAPGAGSLAVGDQVKLQLVAAGCGLGNHYGHVYVDGFGGAIPTLYTWASAPSTVLTGGSITYTVNYKNGSATDATGTTVEFTTPPKTTFASLTGASGCTTPAAGATGKITCPIGALAAGASGSFQVKVNVPLGASGGPVLGEVVTAGQYDVYATGVPALIGSKVDTTVQANIAVNSGGTQSTNVSTAFGSALQVKVTDATGAALNNAVVTFAAPASGASATLSNTTRTTGTAGTAQVNATANATPGTYQVTASLSGGTSATFNLTNVGGPASITAVSGTPQTPTVNTALTPIVAVVKDAAGTVLSGRSVTFSAQAGAGGASATVSGGAVTTDASGQASTTPTANTVAGAYTITARTGALSTTFSITNVAGAPKNIAIVSGNSQSATVGTDFAAGLVTRVTDNWNNLVSGATVTYSPVAGASGASASVVGTPASTGTNGQTSATVHANTTSGAFTVSASAPGVTTPATFSLTNLAAAAASIDVSSGSGQSATVGTQFGQQLVAIVRDAYSNPVSGASVAFAAPASGASATLTAPTTVTTGATGLATLATKPTAKTLAGTYSVTATTGSFSTGFTLTNTPAAAASVSVVSGSGQSVAVNGAFADLVAVVRDGYGNAVPGASVAFTPVAASNGATANLVGSPATSLADGTASVSASAGSVAGSYTVTASTTGATSASFGLTNALGPGMCFGDSDCTGGKWCQVSTQTCTSKLANGTAMPSDPPHVSPTLNGACTASAATLVCQTSVCDTDNLCGWATGTTGCAASTADARCRSGSCSSNGTCKPAAGCNADGDCLASQYCDTGAHLCAAKLANGAPVVAVSGHVPDLSTANCTTNASIASVECVTAVCDVDDACGWANGRGNCTPGADARCRSESCSTNGKCVVTGGCNVDGDCSGGKWCDESTSTCTAKLANGTAIPNDPPHANPTLNGSCTQSAATLVCETSVCDADGACGWIDGTRGCTAGGADGRCRSGQCSTDGSCKPNGGCNADGDCASNQYCNDGLHLCTAKIANGFPVVAVAGHVPDLTTANCTTNASIAGVECLTAVCDVDNSCGWKNATAGCTAETADVRCRSVVCDVDSKCGWADGTSGCTAGAADARCRSNACSVDGRCMPAGGCNLDGDCAADKWCNEAAHACSDRLPNATPMPNDPTHVAPTLDGTCSVAAGSLVCVSRVCDAADSKCGFGDGHGDCDPNDPAASAVVCRSGLCSVTGVCEGAGTCYADGDCNTTVQFCDTGAHLCTSKLANSTQIPTISGHVPALAGACSQPVADSVCATDACDADGACGWLNSTLGCVASQLDARCRTGVCDLDGACGWANGTSGCTASTLDSRCRSGACGGDGKCMPSGGCNIDVDCPAGSWCNESQHRCAQQLANETAMPNDPPHASPALDGTCTLPAAALVCATGVCDADSACGWLNGTTGCSAGFADERCRSGVCDPDGACGYEVGVGPCSAANAAKVCRSGKCSTNLLCAPAAGCLVDGDCDVASQYCDTPSRTCVAKLANAALLPIVAGHVPVLDGTCGDGVGAAVCLAGVCDSDGRCGLLNGDASCSIANAAKVCRSGVCDSDLACGYADGRGQCAPGVSPASVCRSGVCSQSGVCLAPASCLVDSDCLDTQFCDTGAAKCTAKLVNGAKLPTISGHSPALDGTCTATVGTTVCASGVCDVDGKCGIANGDPGCSVPTGPEVCRSGVCDADGKCGLALGDSTCTSTAQCRSGVCVSSGAKPGSCEPCGSNGDCSAAAGKVCDVTTYACVVCTATDHGACAGATPFCDASARVCVGCTGNAGSGAPYACGFGAPYCAADGSCSTACQADSDCAATDWCDAGSCVAKLANGQPMPSVEGHAPTLDGSCTPLAAAAVCAAGVCDLANATCGLLPGTPGCTLDAQCQAGRCVPPGGGVNEGRCEPCLTNADCAGTTTTVCDAATNECVACDAANATACGGLTPVCDLATDTCAPCNGDFGSGATLACSSSAAPHCAANGACGRCALNAECAGAHPGPICNTASGACGTACTLDTDCPGQWCDDPSGGVGAGVCAPKISNGDPMPSDAPISGNCTAESGKRVCVAAVCDANDDRCGVKNGDPCASKDACRSGVCNADGKCGDPNGTACTKKDTCRSDVCFSDGLCGEPDGADCTSADVCRAAVCTGGQCGEADAGVDAGADADAGDADAADAGDAADALADVDAASDARLDVEVDAGVDAGDKGEALEGGTCGACNVGRKTPDAGALAGVALLAGLVLARRRRRGHDAARA